MFVEKLVALMPSDALELKNCDGETTLHFVAAAGLIRAAKAMVTKNPNLTQMRDNNEWVPLVTAAYSANSSNERSKEMVKYLCSVTRDEEPSPYYGVSGGTLICICIASNLYDVALYLVQRFPNLATEKSEDGYCALEAMAERPSAFPSGNERTLWQQFLYSFRSAKQIHDEELMQKHALALVKCICKQISLKSSTEIFKIFTESDALELATRFGAVEIVVECVQTFPDLMCIRMKTNMTVLEEAIKYRREKIFNLICEMNADKKMASFVYDENNTILHWVAKLANPQSLNSVSGSALQMQRELQWFKEVEKITLQRHRQKKNDEGKTGRDLFTEEHKELLEKAEKWMKDTANSCMLVATLITTVVFAAAFTVPGGNNSDNSSNNNGIPIFLNTTSFAVFAIADASALFSSITAVLMFFSILSSRYSEDDFLYSLPKRLTIGYANLFFSIATMIVAFGAALSIVLQPRWTWIPVPIALFACVPVTLFALLQLPLFVTLVRSTYGPSIFRREDQRMKWSY
ncbi:ankyrin repeat-containing protein NPR4-like [Papaver somniferum]|uniref:ankyrin repeat-containing protein NPR4-like n=1 Tax=Papaver somniferum TaxID=3469 RepID=UPI000E705D46|nr:ankyrin repeat-containing protein NPR4-like [Papaver somniferum]XP_026434502.1 ankyrin repeat-containing protein NPR4-like [Papaver somniferum]